MIVNHELKLVFVATPRTASRSMSAALMELPGSKELEGGRHRNQIPEEALGYWKFAFVRNPYSREYSHYRYRQKNDPPSPLKQKTKDMTFGQYVKWHVEDAGSQEDPPQAEFLRNIKLDLLLRFEELPQCLMKIPRKFADRILKRPYFRFPHLYRLTVGQDWRNAYNASIAVQIQTWARQDFIEFNYDPNSWITSDALNPGSDNQLEKAKECQKNS